MRVFTTAVLLFSCLYLLGGSFDQELVLMKPTGNKVDSLPEMVLIGDTSDLFIQTHQIIENSFVSESVEFYYIVQQYLLNEGKVNEIELAYLALTENQGGYAKRGFVLNLEGTVIKKPNTYYIDITQGNIESGPSKLMSVTQLYPHELGHVIYRLLSFDDSAKEESKSVDMHYFSIITDYQIAFNEGFAEHLENVARLFESNDSIRTGIFEDIEAIREKSEHYIQGFERDFKYWYRLDYYKATMLFWYQQFEDYKRHEYAVNNRALFKNTSISKGSIEDRITFRNSGVRANSNKRNLTQALATEGVISSFFTSIIQSELPNKYREQIFYTKFLPDSNIDINPKQLFNAVQNQMIKNFYVLNRHVVLQQSSGAQLIDFVKGYCIEFPDEAQVIKMLFKQSTGHEFILNVPPQIWLMAKDHDHRLIVLDPFGALTIPVYTFRLNTAEVEDLQVLGINEKQANKIVEYRNKNGLFWQIDDLKKVPELQSETMNAIQNNLFDQTYLDSLAEPDLDIKKLILTPVWRLMTKGIIWFVLMMGFGFALYRATWTKNYVRTILLFTALWMVYIIIGLIAVIVNPNPLLIVLPGFIILLIPAFIKFRNNKPRLIQHIIMNSMMVAVIAFSVW